MTRVGFQRLGTIIACAAGCMLAGAASALVSPRDDRWYAALAKPAWTPPPWTFGVVWSLLYALIGVALAYVLLPNAKRGGRAVAAVAFGVQLLLNLAWSPIFFGLHSVGGALIDLVVLWLAVAWALAACWSVSDVAGVLLLPYWIWVTFALALNGAISRMN